MASVREVCLMLGLFILWCGLMDSHFAASVARDVNTILSEAGDYVASAVPVSFIVERAMWYNKYSASRIGDGVDSVTSKAEMLEWLAGERARVADRYQRGLLSTQALCHAPWLQEGMPAHLRVDLDTLVCEDPVRFPTVHGNILSAFGLEEKEEVVPLTR